MEIRLKYGCNPNQRVARVRFEGDGDGPLRVVHGEPSYINVLDALRGWQLVRELRASLGKPAAASFKHVSPAGAAVAGPLDETFRRAHLIDTPDLSPAGQAYAKARSSDRSASFGDFIAVSEVVDESLARLIKPEVSDGIIAPGYELGAAELLRSKKGGKYVMFEVDPGYEPPAMEDRLEFGLRLEQSRNDAVIDRALLANVVTERRELPEEAAESLRVASITLKHTQSNSVAVAAGGQAVGIGAGQQSRIACTRLACDKYDRWLLKSHPQTLALAFKPELPRAEKVNVVDQFVRWDELGEPERRELVSRLSSPPTPITPEQRWEWAAQHRGAALGSDAFFPFRDNLDRAARSGVGYVMQAGGSKRDDDLIAAANEHRMVMVMSGLRLFLH